MQVNGVNEPIQIESHIEWNKDDLFTASTGNYELSGKDDKGKKDKADKPKEKK